MVMTTTPTVGGREIVSVIGLVAADIAFGMNLFKDIATGWRDVVGGRAKAVQKVIADSRVAALQELEEEARRVDADAVVGIDLDFTEFSSGVVSGGMILVLATGTAVKLRPLDEYSTPPAN